MTPERKKWWDSLPANEKELREVLKSCRGLFSIIKANLAKGHCNAYIITMMRRQKLLIKAIKHELDRTTTMVYTDSCERVSLIYRCEKCDGIVVDNWQRCCPWCGREIKEWKDETI